MKKTEIWLIIAVIFLLIWIVSLIFSDKIDENLNVKTNNFTLFNITEPALINLDVSQLVLDSHDVESGYTLKREFSGFIGNENYYYFVKKFDKEVLTNVKEIRTVYSEAYKFRTIEETDEGFRRLLNELVSEDYNPDYQILDFEQVGDSSFLYRMDYFYNFYPFERYVAVIKDKNVVFVITLSGYANAVEKSELIYYVRKVIELSNEEPKENLEIPKNQMALLEENLKVELRINNENSSKINSYKSGEILNDYNNELKVEYNSEKGFYTYSFYNSDKQFLKINTCINNSYGTISIIPKFFYLIDNDGNRYTAFTKKDSNSVNPIDSLNIGKETCLSYVFPTFKGKNYFRMIFNSDKGLVLGKSSFYLNDIGKK